MSDDMDDDRAATDEFEIALARGLMRGVWTAATSAVVFGVLSFCCGMPVGGAALGRLLGTGLGVFAIFAACLTGARLWSMPAEYRSGLTNQEMGAAMALAIVGVLLGGLQLLGTLLWLLLA